MLPENTVCVRPDHALQESPTATVDCMTGCFAAKHLGLGSVMTMIAGVEFGFHLGSMARYAILE